MSGKNISDSPDKAGCLLPEYFACAGVDVVYSDAELLGDGRQRPYYPSVLRMKRHEEVDQPPFKVFLGLVYGVSIILRYKCDVKPFRFLQGRALFGYLHAFAVECAFDDVPALSAVEYDGPFVC